MNNFRCRKCHKLLARYYDCIELEIKCPRCNSMNCLQPIKQGNVNHGYNTVVFKRNALLTEMGKPSL